MRSRKWIAAWVAVALLVFCCGGALAASDGEARDAKAYMADSGLLERYAERVEDAARENPAEANSRDYELVQDSSGGGIEYGRYRVVERRAPQLMKDTPSQDEVSSNTGNVFGSDIPRASIHGIRFLDSLNRVLTSAWDVSANQDRSVLAWVVADEDDGYVLTIAGDGGVRLPEDCQFLFSGYTGLTSLRFDSFVDTSEVTSMYAMFYNCTALERLDLNNFDTGRVVDMGYMFAKCAALERLDIDNFDTSAVTSMNYMFYNTESLMKMMPGDGFVIGDGCDTANMFDNCLWAIRNGLTEAPEGGDSGDESAGGADSDGEASNEGGSDEGSSNEGASDEGASDEGGSNGEAAQSPGLLRDDTLSDEEYAALGGYVLGSDLPRASVLSVNFADSLADAPEGAWDVSADGSGSVLAWAAPNGEMYDLTIAGNGGVRLGGCVLLFSNYLNLESLRFNGCADSSEVTSMQAMFLNCPKLRELDLSGIDTAQVEDMAFMFAFCTSLESLDLGGFDTARVTCFDYMLCGTENLRNLNLGERFTIRDDATTVDMVTNSGVALSADASDGEAQGDAGVGTGGVMAPDYLESEEIMDGTGNVYHSDIPRSRVTGITFYPNLDRLPDRVVDVSLNGDASVVSWMEADGDKTELCFAADGPITLRDGAALFANYTNLESIQFNGCVRTEGMPQMCLMFYNCAKLRELDLHGFDTSSVTDMWMAFSGCSSLEMLDLRDLDTSNVTSMAYMLAGTSSLTYLYLGDGFIVPDGCNTEGIFNGCKWAADIADN